MDTVTLATAAGIIVAFFMTSAGSMLLTQGIKTITSLSGQYAYYLSWIVAAIVAVIVMFASGELTTVSFSYPELAATIGAVGLVAQNIYDKIWAGNTS